MMTMYEKKIASTSIALLLFLFSVSAVFAQDATTTESTLEEVGIIGSWYESERISGNIDVGDFVVGPGKMEVELAPGESKTVLISVTNRISADRTFRLEVEDITGSSDAENAVSLTGDAIGPYSIRDYISFPSDTFTLDLGERARIPVTITLPPDAEPGGLYGSVLVSTIQTSVSNAELAPSSPLIARVGTLIFLRVTGETEIVGQTLSIDTLDDKTWYDQGPVTLGILSENTGSIHLNPYGEISITNMLGEEVGFVEIEPWFVLPNSLRLREIVWDREFLLGRYTATAKINRGYDDVIDEVSVSFWVLPLKLVAATFLVIFIIIFSIRAFFRTFEFKRKSAE